MFDFNFSEIIGDLGDMTFFEIANEARPASRYLFSSLLPETNLPDYSVETGDMTIRPTMAGLTGESSPYPKGGQISTSEFLEKTAKLANQVPLGEGQLRKLQSFYAKLSNSNGNTTDFLVEEVLNFYDKVIIQAHIDAMEWLRAQALLTGKIEWTFNDLNINIDYGVDSGNIFSEKTGTDAYDQSGSTFWADLGSAREKLKYNIRAIIAHPTTIFNVVGNSANNMQILNQSDDGTFTVRRLLGNNERPSEDSNETIRFIAYGEQGSMIDPNDPSDVIDVDFLPVGKILIVANNTRSAYRVGEGSTDDPALERSLGYTHIGPTVEAGGASGRWGRVYTPQQKPWMLVGEGVTNGLPVIEAPDKICVLNTEINGA